MQREETSISTVAKSPGFIHLGMDLNPSSATSVELGEVTLTAVNLHALAVKDGEW